MATLDFYFNFKYIHIDIFATSKDVDKLLWLIVILTYLVFFFEPPKNDNTIPIRKPPARHGIKCSSEWFWWNPTVAITAVVQVGTTIIGIFLRSKTVTEQYTPHINMYNRGRAIYNK